MSFGITPRASYKPLGRQPFRPGQWQGYKAASKHTTYIQNNFFASGYNSGYNYGNYGYYDNYDSGLSKGMKWLLGIGIGTSLLGGILKLFGVGAKEEAGGVETEPRAKVDDTKNDDAVSQNKENDGTEKTDKTDEQGGAKTPTSAEKPETPTEPETNPYDWSSFNNMICRDSSGKTQNISGNLNITQQGAAGEPPKEFTITDNSSGTPHTYTYQLAGTSSDGKPIYNCVSMNGQPINGSAQYTLETKADGTPELVQYEKQSNYGQGLRFGSLSSHTPSSAENNTPAAETPAQNNPPAAEEEKPEVETKPQTTANGTDIGHDVAEDLVGYTNDAEKERVITNIKHNVDTNNIEEFLNSYNENKGFGDNILKQINTEYGWTNSEKFQAQKKILQSLMTKAESKGIQLDATTNKYVQDFLTSDDNSKISNEKASNLDQIINRLLEELK